MASSNPAPAAAVGEMPNFDAKNYNKDELRIKCEELSLSYDIHDTKPVLQAYLTIHHFQITPTQEMASEVGDWWGVRAKHELIPLARNFGLVLDPSWTKYASISTMFQHR